MFFSLVFPQSEGWQLVIWKLFLYPLDKAFRVVDTGNTLWASLKIG
jgi:hypothetical protein